MPFIGNTPAAVPLTSADIADSIITSAKIVDGTIVNADINASAAIASTKLSGVGITLGTSVASTSGTSIDFTGLPSTAKRIIVMFNEVSTNGTSNCLLQLGDSGGIENTGYASSSTSTTTSSGISYSTAGFVLRFNAAAVSISGALRFNLINSNTWVAEGTFSDYASTNGIVAAAGTKTLSATLDRVRITTVNGTDTFDAGTINISYE